MSPPIFGPNTQFYLSSPILVPSAQAACFSGLDDLLGNPLFDDSDEDMSAHPHADLAKKATEEDHEDGKSGNPDKDVSLPESPATKSRKKHGGRIASPANKDVLQTLLDAQREEVKAELRRGDVGTNDPEQHDKDYKSVVDQHQQLDESKHLTCGQVRDALSYRQFYRKMNRPNSDHLDVVDPRYQVIRLGGASCVPRDSMPKEIVIYSDHDTYGFGTEFHEFTNTKNRSGSKSLFFPWQYRAVYDSMPKRGE